MAVDVPEVQRCGSKNRVRHKNNLEATRKAVGLPPKEPKYIPEPENFVTPTRIHLAADGTKYLDDRSVKVGGEWSTSGHYWRRS